MKLLASNSSPYVRKVRIAILEKGLADKIEDVVVNPLALSAEMTAANPLAKVPTLIFDDGHTLFDSSVIVEYLDSIGTGAKLIPEGSGAQGKWAAKRWEVIAHGILESAVMIRLETVLRPPEQQSPTEIERQFGKIDRALTLLETEVEGFANSWTLASISVACALSYLDFRFASLGWRDRFPKLAAFEAACNNHQSYRQTTLVG